MELARAAGGNAHYSSSLGLSLPLAQLLKTSLLASQDSSGTCHTRLRTALNIKVPRTIWNYRNTANPNLRCRWWFRHTTMV